MLKRNAAVATVAVLVLGAGAYAWAQGSPSRPTTSTTAAPADGRPNRPARPGRAGRAGLLRRVVHGDLIVRGKDGFQNVTYDRGKVTDASVTSVTIMRPDHQSVTKTIDGSTQFKGIKDASQLQKDKPAIVVSKGNTAVVVAQRSADTAGADTAS